ncbi:ParB/RepB/Spo0J family partition protein [Salmonella enterica]|nr:ParB/RepB/Spo0J family partition protein [Salmonella enterica]EBZ2196369.1 ParB/RepB/Spo0J family partition protein [Salmonella enterica subsp. enterica serovar Bareilly]ECG2965776.1 ParB/RepB/Spo0J family partition protein [Salmonella enterica subsp. enterica serovar Sandiego]ECH9485433.1 ParB/RepB/Spo0J family partition protein [Salmonella enterica subsp. enterica]EHL2011291.1 ParB/RepB/Spo0J family partition protein [Salmonella enterica]
MSNIKGPLISSQRYLDKAKVNDRAARFKRFIVSVYPIVLRGQQYTILMDGHHNYAAAKLAGIEPDYRPITKKVQRILCEMSGREREAFFINNVTDSNYYFVETGEVVHELVMPDTSCKFQAHAGNQWIFGGAGNLRSGIREA